MFHRARQIALTFIVLGRKKSNRSIKEPRPDRELCDRCFVMTAGLCAKRYSISESVHEVDSSICYTEIIDLRMALFDFRINQYKKSVILL